MYAAGWLVLLSGCPKAPEPDLSAVPVQVDAEAEAAQAVAYEAIALDYARGDAPGALAGIAAFRQRWPSSPAEGLLVGWADALGRVGQPAPALDGVRWRHQVGGYSPVTLVVFFEPWCPHCQVEVPTLELLRRDYAERGLGMVGLTQLSRESTEADLTTFVERGFLGFPVGVEDGTLTEAYGVDGVPSLAIVRDGRIAWAGHPAFLSTQLVEAALSPEGLPVPREAIR